MSDFQPVENTAGPGEAEALIASIRALVPDAFDESGVNLDVLATILSGTQTSAAERFGLSWPGKAASRRLALLPPSGTLLPRPDESVDWDSTKNLMIEGNNLEVLRLLRRPYAGKVDAIYIDPPYNTGNDFVYLDRFTESARTYEEKTGQRDSQGYLVANTDATGRRHSNWLSMMAPRLRIARDLLSDRGVVFVSIDDNEIQNLTCLMNEVFGPENHVNTFVWISNLKGRQISVSGAAGTKEYVVCFAKSIDNVDEFRSSATALKKLMPSIYKGFNYEVLYDEHGSFVVKNELYNTNSAFNEATRPNLVYDIYYSPVTGEVRTSALSNVHEFQGLDKIVPKRNNNGTHRYHAYRWSRAKVEAEARDLHFVRSGLTWKVYTKVRDVDSTTAKDVILGISTSDGSTDLSRIGADPKWFDYPKPVSLLKTLLGFATQKDSLVLDFFAGSGSTGHAVMELNASDTGRRQYILIQLDEPVDRAAFATIADITRERLRRAGKAVTDEQGLDADSLDLGFRSYLLADSNLRKWDGTLGEQSLEDAVATAVDNLLPGRSTDDLLVEMMLRLGVELTTPVDQREVAGSPLYNLGGGTMFAYFGTNITVADATQIAQEIRSWHAAEGSVTEAAVVVRDTGFADSAAKLNLAAALNQAGITNLRSM